MLLDPPTIVAQASGLGRAGIAVVRVSGKAARAALARLLDPAALPSPRRADLRDIFDPRSGEKLDRALVLWFPAPRSFTGEDLFELHLHGGRAVIAGVIEALCSLDGVAPATAGEFSRRAFENGKLDLVEAEAIADLVDAQTAAQRKQALRQMEGALGRLYANWAVRLTRLLAFIEAETDFANEELPDEITKGRAEELVELAQEIGAHLDDNRRGERLREGFAVALLGAPNAGKSSLLNALARREAAIVSETPGTTRDVIEVSLDLSGYPVTLADTAGLREAAEEIESEGVRRALARADAADLKILLFDGTGAPDRATLELRDDRSLLVVNKSDVMKTRAAFVENSLFSGALYLSVKTGDGIAAFEKKLTEEIERRFGAGETPALTRARHRAALEECREALIRAQAAALPELCAEDLRLAVRALGRITGRVDVEDLLDVIFGSFCIGK